jgi:AcrR family transcriptional regulator
MMEAMTMRHASKGRRRPAPPPRARREPEEAKGLIVDAAERVFAERGPDAVGLKDVAREAGVSHALVSHYFGTFEGLVDAVLERHTTRLRSQILAAVAEAGDEFRPSEVLRRFWDAIADPATARLMAWAVLSGRLGDTDFFPSRAQNLRIAADAIEQRIRRFARVSREDVEFIVMTSMALSWGYALLKKPLYMGMGRPLTPAADEDFRDRVAELVRLYASRQR